MEPWAQFMLGLCSTVSYSRSPAINLMVTSSSSLTPYLTVGAFVPKVLEYYFFKFQWVQFIQCSHVLQSLAHIYKMPGIAYWWLYSLMFCHHPHGICTSCTTEGFLWWNYLCISYLHEFHGSP